MGGPDDKGVNVSAEYELERNSTPYNNKKYLKENGTSKDFLESISYLVPISGMICFLIPL